jgi:hypothetical protein
MASGVGRRFGEAQIMWLRISASLLVGLICASSAAAKGPFTPLQVGNWSGGSYTDDKTGAFSHCSAEVKYVSGQFLLVAAYANGDWSLGFADPGWNLREGANFDARIYIDNVGPFELTGRAATKELIIVQMPNTDVATEAFRNGLKMFAEIGRKNYRFDLTSTMELLPALRDCVAQASEKLSQSAPDNAPTKPPDAPSTPSRNAEADKARDALISDLTKQYNGCIDKQMREIVPYSNEGAEVLSQAIVTNCNDIAQKFIETTMALYNMGRADVEKIVDPTLDERKKKILAEIVSFRAAVNKAISSQPKSPDQGEKGTGL